MFELTFLMPMLMGLVLGVFSSLPPGPINMLVAQLSHSGKQRVLAWFVAGVILADVGVACLALLGMLTAHLSTEILRSIGLVGGGVFLIYGLFGLLRPRRDYENSKSRATSVRLSFTSGLIFCGLNPAFYLFWIYGASLLIARTPVALSSSILFLFGVLLGDIFWFLFLYRVVTRFRDKVKINTLRMASFTMISFFGAYAVWRSFDGSLALF